MPSVVFALAASADETPIRNKTIGFVSSTSEGQGAKGVSEFWKRLGELGWSEGTNLLVERRYAGGKLDAFPALMGDMVKLNVDVIVTGGTIGAIAANNATKTIPIVALAMGDPVGSGLAASLARPGGNLTGISYAYSEGFSGKWLQLLHECVPKLTRVGILLNSKNPWSSAQLTELRTIARAQGITVIPMDVDNVEELPAAFKMFKKRVDGAIMLVDSFMLQHRQVIGDLVRLHKVALVTHIPEFINTGALVVYGVDNVWAFMRTAEYVDKILRGTHPRELPIEQPMRFSVSVNLRTAAVLGLKIPESVMIMATEVIK